MTTTPRLGIQEIAVGQASKEIAHNDALRMIDALMSGKSISKIATPPVSPVEGDVHIVDATATGAFLGKEEQIAHFYANAWYFYPAKLGMTLWSDEDNDWIVFDGANWGLANTAFSNVIKSHNSNAFIAGNILPNGNMTQVGYDGRPQGAKSVYSTTIPSVVSYQDSNKTILKLYSSNDNTLGVGFPSFKINIDAEYDIIFRVKSNVVSASGLYVRIDELNTILSIGNTHISTNSSSSEAGVEEATSTTTILNDVAITDGWVDYSLSYTPASGALWASIIFLNWTGMGLTELHIDSIMINEHIADGAITNKDSSFVAGSIALNNTTMTSISSLSFISTGKSINLSCFFSPSDNCLWQLKRGATVLIDASEFSASGASIIDTPAAGAYTYELFAQTATDATGTAEYRSISAIENKK